LTKNSNENLVPQPTRTYSKKNFTILGLFAEPFLSERKPGKCPAKEKKAKKAGRRESKR